MQGVGQVIKHCYDVEKIKTIILGSGGSAFVDGGLGAIHALDVFDIKLDDGSIFPRDEIPRVNLTHRIADLILRQSSSSILDELEIIMPCDVKNPLLGPHGSAYVFGPQKGARHVDLPILDARMEQMIKLQVQAKKK